MSESWLESVQLSQGSGVFGKKSLVTVDGFGAAMWKKCKQLQGFGLAGSGPGGGIPYGGGNREAASYIDVYYCQDGLSRPVCFGPLPVRHGSSSSGLGRASMLARTMISDTVDGWAGQG